MAPWLSIGLILYYFATRIDLASTAENLKQLSFMRIAAGVFLTLLGSVTLSTLQYVACTKLDIRNGLKAEVINANVLGYSTVLPSAVVAAYKISAFQKLFESTSKAIAYFVANKISSLIVASLALMFICIGNEKIRIHIERQFLTAGMGRVVLMVAAALLLLGAGYKMARRTQVVEKAAAKMRRSMEDARAIIGRRGWFFAISTQCVAFLLTLATSITIAYAIDKGIPTEALVVGRAVTLIALLAPISVAGVGARELSLLAILPFYHVKANEAAALLLGLLIIQWTSGIAAMAYAHAIKTYLASRDRP